MKIIETLLCILHPSKLKENHLKENQYQSIKAIRKNLFRSFIIVIGTLIISLFFVHLLNIYITNLNLKLKIKFWLQLISAFILLWSTYAKLISPEIMTFSMSTLPEKINNTIFNILYLTGSLLLIISIIL